MSLSRVCCSLVLLALGVFVFFTGGADATPFTILPGGNLEIDTTFTSGGVFSCLGTVPCSGSGTNSVVLGSGTNTVSVTFLGVSGTFPVIANGGSVVPIGEFVTASPSGATFPIVPSSPHAPLLGFNISILQSSPAGGVSGRGYTFGEGGGGTVLPLLGESNYVQLPIGLLQPPGYHYSALVYSFDPYPFSLTTTNGVLDLEANVGAIPEPTTLLLFGTTMAGLGLARWKRRSRK
jgi:PEP-CTERM motif-containing protein